MRLFLLLLLLPLIAEATFYYEIHGHLNSIEAKDVSKPSNFQSQRLKVEQQLRSLVNEKFGSFVLEKFEIHGEDVHLPSAIFYGYLSTNVKVTISEIQSSQELEVFYFGERESVPEFIVPNEDATTICVNGGFSLPNSTCACPTFYTGTKCQYPICMNNGIIDGNRCACPPGHYSVNCEPRGCLPPIQDKFDNSKQTFILVLNQRSSMSYVLNAVITGMANSLATIADMNPLLIDNYIISNYVYSSKGTYYLNQKYFKSQTDFLNYIYGIAAVDGAPTQYTNRAIYSAQNFDPYMRGFSNVFVFTDTTDATATGPSYRISSATDELNAISQSISWRNRVIYLISQMKGQLVDNNGESYATYRRVSAATLGDIVSFDMLEISTILNTIIPSYLQNENIAVTYGTTSTSTTIPQSDTGSVTILITVEPNGTLPTLTANAALQTNVTGSRFMLLTGSATVGSVAVTATTPYSLRAWVISTKTALLAYSTDQYIDIGSAYIPAELAPYVSANVIGFTDPAVYSFIDNSGTVTIPMKNNSAYPRSFAECSLPFTFGNFTNSMDPGNRWVQLTFGTAVRIVPGFTGILDYHNSVPFMCFNGGTQTGPSSCQCTTDFSGTNCAIPVCYYGGKVNPFPGNGNPLCLCPTGYSGNHCNSLQCPIVPGLQIPFGTARTLSLVLQTSMSQAGINNNIYQGFVNLISSLKGIDAFDEYMQTTFNNIIRNGQNYTQILSTSTDSSDQFLYGLESDNVQYLASSSPTQDSFGALMNAINLLDNDKSSIFLFVDSPPQNPEVNENDIIDAAVTRQLEINIVITPPYGMKELCMNSGGLFESITQKTGGIILNLCNPYGNYNNDPIVQFLTSYGASHHHTENLNEALSTSGPISIDFFVDNYNDEIYGFINCDSENFTATLTNKDTSETVTLLSMATLPFVGVYRITPSFNNVAGYTFTAQPTATNLFCSIRVSERTLSALYLGFSSNPSIDRQSTTLLYGIPTSPVAHPYAGSYLINASSVAIRVATDDGTVLYNATGIQRQSCQMNWYFATPFVCNQPYSTFVITSTTYTYSGTYERTQRGFCYLKHNTCLNGGIYDTDDNRCICTYDYTGDWCETPICQNGGTVQNFACNCATGFTGQFCQYGACDNWNFMETNDFRQTDFKQLTFVLNRNSAQLLVNIYLDQILQSIVQNTESPITPTQYTLIQFDENGYYDIVSTSHQQKFLDTFHNAINNVVRTAPPSTKALSAIYEAIKLSIQPPNIVYVFTGSQTDLPPGMFRNVLRQQINTQINLFYTPASQNYPTQPSGNLAYAAIVARQSGGRVLSLTPNSITEIGPILISTVKEDAFIADDGAKDCSGGVQFNFFVESTFSRVVIEISGAAVSNPGNIALLDGANVPVSYATLFKDTAAMILSINSSIVTTTGGRWTANVTTASGSCFIQVRSQSAIRVIPGFTSSPTSDFVKTAPFTPYGTNPTTWMTFRVIDTADNVDINTSLTTLSIFHTQFYLDWPDTTLVSNIPITKRDPTNCANQYMATWQEDKFSYQKFVVTGTDVNHVQFQRTFFFSMPKSTADANAQYCVQGTRNSYGECGCKANYKGDYCDQRICQNGGSSSYNICACVNGYFGDYCDQYLILPANTTQSPIFY